MVKFIYAGYSKCGTKTIAHVFKKLGYRVYDQEEFYIYTLNFWKIFNDQNNSVEEKQKAIYDMLKNTDVVTDMPFYLYWKEILDVFPNAKVIFYERPEDEWFISLCHTMDILANSTMRGFLHKYFLYFFCPTVYKGQSATWNDFSVQFTGLRFNNHLQFKNWRGEIIKVSEIHAKRAYRQHCSDVKMHCPKENLIHFDTLNFGNYENFCHEIGIDGDSENLSKHQKDIYNSCKDLEWPVINKNSELIKRALEMKYEDSVLRDIVKSEIKNNFLIYASCFVIVIMFGYAIL